MSSRYQELVGVLCESGQNNEAKNLSQSSDVVSKLESIDEGKFNDFLEHLKGEYWEYPSKEWRSLPRASYVMNSTLYDYEYRIGVLLTAFLAARNRK